jgi:hypothetical protein
MQPSWRLDKNQWVNPSLNTFTYIMQNNELCQIICGIMLNLLFLDELIKRHECLISWVIRKEGEVKFDRSI